jgi:hypothetical protein
MRLQADSSTPLMAGQAVGDMEELPSGAYGDLGVQEGSNEEEAFERPRQSRRQRRAASKAKPDKSFGAVGGVAGHQVAADADKAQFATADQEAAGASMQVARVAIAEHVTVEPVMAVHAEQPSTTQVEVGPTGAAHAGSQQPGLEYVLQRV